MNIKTGKDLATACLDVANNYKTLYVMGCFGAPMTDGNKVRYINHHSYNQSVARKTMINAASDDTFGFDCVCLIKGLLWGWKGDKSKIYGGASYGTNGVPDVSADSIINLCKDVSTDFSKIQVGELLWMSGHVGIYIGDGQAVECTPAWKNCVQVTTVKNIKSGTGHKWTKHGKLPYVIYEASVVAAVKDAVKEPAKAATSVSGLPKLAKGSKGKSVKALQILLKGYGYSLGTWGVDSDFGGATESAVKAFKSKNGLPANGTVDPETWAKLLGV